VVKGISRSARDSEVDAMFVGHYSASFAGKASDKPIPLWLLFVAVQFIDVLWSIFVLLGIEKVRSSEYCLCFIHRGCASGGVSGLKVLASVSICRGSIE
jgi:hypothetical protein